MKRRGEEGARGVPERARAGRRGGAARGAGGEEGAGQAAHLEEDACAAEAVGQARLRQGPRPERGGAGGGGAGVVMG